MGIASYITRQCTQTAVYWGNPQPDQFGGMTWDDPVEIDCRWEERQEVITAKGDDNRTTEIVSKARVFVTQDVDEQGCLYLGTLDDLDSTDEENPEQAADVYRIRKFNKIPALGSTDEFIRTAYI